MEDPMLIYEIFNRLEGAVWFGLAIGLPFYLRPRSKRQRYSVAAASLGFILFGISDFLEAPLRGQLPIWLWIYKIACAALILSCRFSMSAGTAFAFRIATSCSRCSVSLRP